VAKTAPLEQIKYEIQPNVCVILYRPESERKMAFHCKKFRAALLLALLSCSPVLTGCGPGDNVKVYPVSGTITFLGKPMEGGGGISFIPLEGQSGKAAGGTIDASGNYVMGTYSSRDGSMPGEFRVVITQITDSEPENTGDDNPPGESEQLVPPDRRIPLLYSDSRRSPLTTRVEEGKNKLDFELTRVK